LRSTDARKTAPQPEDLTSKQKALASVGPADFQLEKASQFVKSSPAAGFL
jgi:hypothetical protein